MAADISKFGEHKKNKQDNVDWSSIKFETQKMEAFLGEWFLNGEIKYLRGWSFALAEKRAEYIGMPLDCKGYFQLQTATRYQIFKELYEDCQERVKLDPNALFGLEYEFAKYRDIGRFVENEMERITRPEGETKIINEKQSCVDEDQKAILMVESGLSEYLCKEDIALLRNASFEYAERKACELNIKRGSSGYKRLHFFARYELMLEAEETIQDHPDSDFEFCASLVRDLAEYNDLELIVKEHESNFKKDF